jgi:hypothetical protein
MNCLEIFETPVVMVASMFTYYVKVKKVKLFLKAYGGADV